MKKKKSLLRRSIEIVLGILGLVIVAVALYVGYVFFSYHRLKDNLQLSVDVPGETSVTSAETSAAADGIYTITTYNIGFGAYHPDYTFFMDGGKSSVADDEATVLRDVSGSADLIGGFEPDFALFQEVDLNSTRSYHVNEYTMLRDKFPEYASVCAVNYDSAFLFYPVTDPHGKSLSSMATFSKYSIESSLRRSLPISTGFNKFFDLDRCYTITRIPLDNGKTFCLFNVHLSAYSDDAAIREGQFEMLCGDMQAEYEKGNYVICGGDFNHDFTGESAAYFNGEASSFSWAQPLPTEYLPEGFSVCADTVGSLSPTARNNDIPYIEGETFVVIVDGFIISDNVEMLTLDNYDNGFLFSDHNPVVMTFQFK